MSQFYFEEREESAREEIKRADHLINVSLKYTRTCPVMINAMKRLISAFEMSFDEYLTFALTKKKIEEIPQTAKEKSILIRSLMGKQVVQYIILYNKLIKITKASYKSVEECRKNVTLITLGNDKSIQVNVSTLEKYLEETKAFVELVNNIRK
jgi:hypothetical protein